MPGLITTHKINHVTTMVKDTAVAMEFYNNLLGIKQIESQVDNPEITWLQLESGIMVHLIETQEAPAKPDRIHHAFEVEDFEGTRCHAGSRMASRLSARACATTARRSCSSTTPTATASSSAPPPATPRPRLAPDELLGIV